MSIIIQNAVYVPKLGYLRSLNRHDFITFSVKGREYMIDGGNEYLRRNFSDDTGLGFTDYTLTDESSLKDICLKLLWGTYGKDGKQPLKWLPICSLSTDHLYAILKMVPIKDFGPCVYDVIRHTLQVREVWSVKNLPEQGSRCLKPSLK